MLIDNKIYKCHSCNWIGLSNDVDWDTTETCMGSDKIEMCPICGSLHVVFEKENKEFLNLETNK
jgi:hypothetical protein